MVGDIWNLSGRIISLDNELKIGKNKRRYRRIRLIVGESRVYWITIYGIDAREILTHNDEIKVVCTEMSETNYRCNRLAYINGKRTYKDIIESEYGSMSNYQHQKKLAKAKPLECDALAGEYLKWELGSRAERSSPSDLFRSK